MSGSILIIDDSVTLLQKIKSHLLLDQYEVVTATTYPEARPHLDRVDLVIIDFHLPGQDGADMVVAFRKALGNAQNPPPVPPHHRLESGRELQIPEV